MKNDIVKELYENKNITDEAFKTLITTDEYDQPLCYYADLRRREYYDDKVYVRGLIEFTNYCRNNCYYCGIRCGNDKADRYRLTPEEILGCCDEGYELGFRTFVLQGGEDMYYCVGY